MMFDRILNVIPRWLKADGPDAGIVISSRARLARNLSGFQYAHREEDEKLAEIVDVVLETAGGAGFAREGFLKNEDMDDLRKAVLLERHLITPTLSERERNRGVLVGDGEYSSILINEEDHLRIQAFCSGFDPLRVWEEADGIDDRFAESILFSFSRRYGYLTACPTNMGTGLRVSILVHLPALVLTKDIQRMIRSAGQIGLTVRGFRGEGSDVVGNLFQISNGVSLGKPERTLVEDLLETTRKIVDYEKKAADTLIKDARHQIEDKIFRSAGILKSARVLSTAEFMNLSSAVRLGVHLGVLAKPGMESLNELLIDTQPGHLQARAGRSADASERDILRASIVRERFLDVRL